MLNSFATSRCKTTSSSSTCQPSLRPQLSWHRESPCSSSLDGAQSLCSSLDTRKRRFWIFFFMFGSTTRSNFLDTVLGPFHLEASLMHHSRTLHFWQSDRSYGRSHLLISFVNHFVSQFFSAYDFSITNLISDLFL